MNRHTLGIVITSLAVCSLVTALTSCTQPSTTDSRTKVTAPAAHPLEPKVGVDEGEDHDRSPLIDMHDVMQAKLVHTQAIVEGLALGDLEQVQINALRLEEASSDSRWMVHDTVTYIVLAEDFRTVARRLAEQAAANNMDGVIEYYAALTNSCVRCHAYLHRERATSGVPGRISMLDVE
jgi:hypothetical protein